MGLSHMSTATPPAPPLMPPDEQFWEKYSPHYEFPLSSIGSIALHVAGLMIFLGALYMLSKMTIKDTTPVPMREMMVMGEGDGSANSPGGSGGGNDESKNENNTPMNERNDPLPPVPEHQLEETKIDLAQFLPKVPTTDDGLDPKNLPSVKKFAGLPPDLRKKFLEGGKGPGGNKGTETGNAPGTGDASSSGSRAVRWELTFSTQNSRDYLRQLAAMKATLIIPQPPDFTKFFAYRNIDQPRPQGVPFDYDSLNGLSFVDDSPESAARIADEMGLNFKPRQFIAIYPKEVEEELAAKERKYRGRREDQIFSTRFKVLIRDGMFSVEVVDQVPIRR